MKSLLILFIAGLVANVGIFLIEEKMISKLREGNRFRSWWRNHIVGDAKDMDI
jgi:hypothetical protein